MKKRLFPISRAAFLKGFALTLSTSLLALLGSLHAAASPKPVAATPDAAGGGVLSDALSAGFQQPPPAARPWVFWFWINGNISKAGITADLEALHRVGVGGVLWMEVSGQAWAPDGKVVPLSPEWHEAFQWAIRECARLGMEFDVTVDFGYGSGGPHITPELSMQKLVWGETELEGGKAIDQVLARPVVEKKISAWLRPGAQIGATVMQQIEQRDSFRDVAVVALPLAASAKGRSFKIFGLEAKSGLQLKTPARKAAAGPAPPDAVTPREQVLDLTALMDREGRLKWNAPPGKWLVIRLGHASNFKMTRPCPQAAVGLECDRLSRAGIEAHFDAFLKPIIEGAGAAAGRTLNYVHVDSWEAGCQNWTAAFPAEFRARRGYELRPWLPVLTGRVVGSEELSERFLWDVRATASELIRDNYVGRLRELARTHGVKLSNEAYGDLCIDNLSYAGVCDLPISEFWARGDARFPTLGTHYLQSSKVMASAAHLGGKPVVGAEAFTSDRAWRDHPFLLKGMGDEMFCQGVNRMIFHLSAHQPYANMIPGLTHRKWGEHFQRNNTWWEYSGPWMDYLARCQYLLQAGDFAADFCYWIGEGAPLNVDHLKLDLPAGYNYDVCSAATLLQMKVRDGRLLAPSGLTYRYLVLPATDRLTLPLARQLQALVQQGARVIAGPRPRATPGLTDFPRGDAELETIAAALWDAKRVITGQQPADVLARDALPPDFAGPGLLHLHRRVGDADVYFVSHQQPQAQDVECAFRVTGRVPELWDPETGAIRALPNFRPRAGQLVVPLHFEPMQSWFVVFRAPGPPAGQPGGENFVAPRPLRELAGPWEVAFDPRWGGPQEPVRFDKLTDWSAHPNLGVRYYSGTARYRTAFDLAAPEADPARTRLALNLGQVEVLARVRLNGVDCGVAWKPPYRVDLSRAARPGRNELELAVVNLWINRMIGDEQLPEDSRWLNFETLAEWPAWFKAGTPRPSGRYTFTTCKHYQKDSPLVPSGLLGPVTLETKQPNLNQ